MILRPGGRSMDPWPCSDCGAPGFRNLGTRGYCTAHLAELYRALSPEVWDLAGVGLPLRRRPDFGDEFHDLECVACGAGWVGTAFAPCSWCDDARSRLVAEQRRQLLDPPWLQTDEGSLRYDELGDDDKAVWDRTRGQTCGEHSLETWVRRLVDAVEAGLITEAEVRRAVTRYDRTRRRRVG